ncbi:hypothetical protein [Actinophytocola sp. NPDC049390]|uniref:hypothetical protein n=1 Tax=Actinophytocola sp. NPDC049390 TaxID=3363894 RepID=UPI003797DFDE
MNDLPPELEAAVRPFENRMAEVRTRLIRTQAELHAEPPSQDEPTAPTDHFDFDHPITSSARR